MDNCPLVWDCAGRNEVLCPPIGAYRDEFALNQDRQPRAWKLHMEHPHGGTDRSNGCSGALGATSKGNLRGKKATFVDSGPPRGVWLRRLPDSVSRRVYLYAQVTGHIGTLPICETLADSLPSRQTGNDDRNSTSPGVILLLGFEQSPISYPQWNPFRGVWARHNSGRLHVERRQLPSTKVSSK